MANIVIIGSGVSGLSAGIFAEKYGHNAIICEKHSVAGGNLTGWQRGAYHIDNCIHWLTGTNPATGNYKTWVELGALGNVEIYQPETLYTCAYGGREISLGKDIEKLQSDMLAVSPADEAETERLIKAVKTVQLITGTGGVNNSEKGGISNLLKNGLSVLKYHGISTGQLADKFTDPLLKKFIVAVFGEKFSALALIIVFATFCGKNGGLPRGGSLAMAKRMAEKFTELGGELLLNKEAVKINTEKGEARSVTFSDGTTLSADYVILAADPRAIFGKVLDAPMPRALEKQYKNPRYVRFSAFHTAFACDAENMPFRGDTVVEVPQKSVNILRSQTLILREFSHEKNFAPEGKNILQTFSFINCEDSLNFIALSKNREAYAEKKRGISEAVKGIIEKNFPQLKGKLRLIDVWTPATYRRYTNAETGSFMSFVLPPKTLPKKITHKVRGLKNVLLATQWQKAPGGLPTAAEIGRSAAKITDRLERKKLKIFTAEKIKKLVQYK